MPVSNENLFFMVKCRSDSLKNVKIDPGISCNLHVFEEKSCYFSATTLMSCLISDMQVLGDKK